MNISRAKDLKPLAIAAFCAVSLLSLAGWFSRSRVYRLNGLQLFDIFWIAIPPLVLSSTTLLITWMRTGRVKRSYWFWIIVPHIGSLILFRKVEIALRAVAYEPTQTQASTYLFWSIVFITEILIWIVAFPYEQLWSPSSEYRSRWRVLLVAIVAGIAALAYAHGLQRIHGFGAIAESKDVEGLQQWMQRICIVVYVFLIIRVFSPRIVSAASASFARESRS